LPLWLDIADRYVLLAPMLRPNAPTPRPNAGGLARPYVPASLRSP
jgi:hypothetical protein